MIGLYPKNMAYLKTFNSLVSKPGVGGLICNPELNEKDTNKFKDL